MQEQIEGSLYHQLEDAYEELRKENKELKQRLKAGQHETIVMWRDANDPPEGNKDCWSQNVIVVTNLRNVYSLSYYHEKDGGVWQRPRDFADGEKVARWTYAPAT